MIQIIINIDNIIIKALPLISIFYYWRIIISIIPIIQGTIRVLKIIKHITKIKGKKTLNLHKDNLSTY